MNGSEQDGQQQSQQQDPPAPAAVPYAGQSPAVQAERSGLRSAAILLLMTLSVGLLIWAGVHNARSRRLAMQQASDRQNRQAMSMPGLATGSTAADADSADQAVPKLQGKPAPSFTLTSLDGKQVSLADFKGKPVLVNFWATWCGPCKLEMPWLEEFHQKYAAQGLVVLGVVAADESGKDQIAKVVRSTGVTYPVLLPNGKVEDAYGGVDFLPESFYVGPDGKIVLETFGTNDGQGGKDQIEANIHKLLAAGQ